jgi:hypothetical protein
VKLSFKNACLVFVGCLLCAASMWIPFMACVNYGMCSIGMNSALFPVLVSVLMLCAGITLIMNYAKVKFD